jgi:uncharacterized membrane protein YsdA (DUF1294 family)
MTAIALAALYAVTSVACFIAYALDKSAARQGRRRTPERTLLLLGLACGWPGGLAAQRMLRHKSSKTSFLIKFWLTVFLNLALLIALQAGWVSLGRFFVPPQG